MQKPVDHPMSPAGVILAGGRSRRMNGELKSLLDLNGKTLINHVIDRVKPQVVHLYLSVEQPSEALAEYGLAQVSDPEKDAGPLAGLLASMQALGPADDWLLLAPCDAPFVPLDLAARLKARAVESGLPGAVVRYESEIQPTFSIWNRNLLPRLEQAVQQEKMRGFKQFLRETELAVLDWPESEPSPFFNINEPAELHQARHMLATGCGENTPCSA